MQLLTLGLNHQTAPLAVRERAAFGPDRLQQALQDVTVGAGAAEATILSTCNRTEIYCGHENLDPERLVNWLSAYSGLDSAELRPSLYQYPDEAAVKHAFRVASGLDSMVLGEPQILGQMKDAYHTAANLGVTGKVLNRMFHHTFNVAKQVRTDTGVGASAVSVAYVGVSLAKKIFDRLERRTALLIGAGETIELVARHLKQQDVRHIIIANRSVDRARILAEEVGSEAIALSAVPERIHEADIVVSSTASTLPILGKGAVERAIRQRRHKPMFILDLAVPRDVESEVAELRDAYLYTVDDLKSLIDENMEARIRAAEEAETIIDLQVGKFMRWMRTLDSVPTIRSFRTTLNELKDAELEKALARLERGVEPQQVIEQLARDLTNKIAHSPSRALRQADIDGNPEVVRAARKLFDL